MNSELKLYKLNALIEKTKADLDKLLFERMEIMCPVKKGELCEFTYGPGRAIGLVRERSAKAYNSGYFLSITRIKQDGTEGRSLSITEVNNVKPYAGDLNVINWYAERHGIKIKH